MKKKILILTGIIIIGLVITAWFVTRSKSPSHVFYTSGTIEGREVNISPMISARIVDEPFREGDAVHKGEVLVRLESDELTAAVSQAGAALDKSKSDIQVYESAVKVARADIDKADADIENARAQGSRAHARMVDARREMNRYKALYRKEMAPKGTLDTAVMNYETAVADTGAAKAALSAAMAEKTSAEARLESAKNQLLSAQVAVREAEAGLSLAKAKLSKTVIACPINGTIVYIAAENGEVVSPGMTIMTVVDMDRLYARVDVDETRVGGIRLHQAATIRTEGPESRTFTGKVIEIGRYAAFATERDVTRGRQDIKTFKVKIDIDNNDGFLKPGMTVDVAIPEKGRA